MSAWSQRAWTIATMHVYAINAFATLSLSFILTSAPNSQNLRPCHPSRRRPRTRIKASHRHMAPLSQSGKVPKHPKLIQTTPSPTTA